ncbi:MAG: hypothetical protein AABN95_22420 [Acidobacteriota bacterium]
MLAILYLAAMTYFGDRICRSFYRFISIQHRLASAFLVGLLLSTCITYLGSLAFTRISQPLIAGNLVFLAVIAVLVYKLPRPLAADTYQVRSPASPIWDWTILGIFFLFGCWLIFTTLGFQDGSFQIPFKAWSDFGANLSLTQSFVLGHNFPTEHPFFPGEIIRYHFLFWFQAANLEFLGLNPVWSVNLLSILSLLALLILIMAFAERLFDSAVVGRVAAFLFFFSTSLSYIPFLRSQPSLREAIHAIVTRTQFISSGYPFRGEDWGVLTVDVFANQRHLISGLGLLFVVLTFLVDRYRGVSLECGGPARLWPDASDRDANASESIPSSESGEVGPKRRQAAALQRDAPTQETTAQQSTFKTLAPYIFSGVLIGCLPYWNGAIFVTAMIILVAFLFLLPCRSYLLTLIATAALIGLPQVLLLRWGAVKPPDQSIFYWGYTLQNPTLTTLVKYLGWTFGFKWLLVFVSLALLSGFHRRMFLAISSLLPVVFLFQLSTDVFNNHKLLNVWSVFAGIYAAYALWRIARLRTVGVALAVLLTVLTIAEGAINLFPVRNDSVLVVPYENDPLTDWVLKHTQPTDVFLTQTVLTHPILFAGRRVYLGYTLFAWTAAYNVAAREQIYRRLFEERDVAELVRLLQQNRIAYVGIDDGVRNNQLIKGLNEPVYQQHFQKVFEDTQHRYDNLTIYKVPQ